MAPKGQSGGSLEKLSGLEQGRIGGGYLSLALFGEEMRDILVTNNGDFLEDGCGYEVCFVDTLDYMTVLEAVRDRVHGGHKLLTHPLSGSVKPFETPYKSVVLTGAACTALDVESLTIVEDAIAMARKFRRERHFNDKLLADFRLIDRDLIEKGM